MFQLCEILTWLKQEYAGKFLTTNSLEIKALILPISMM